GLLRPTSLWPFPYGAVNELALGDSELLAVEDSLGQMVDDVRLGAEGKAPVHFLGMLARQGISDAAMILPGRVLEEIEKLYKGD
ncbi:MAG: 3-methyl-2-oxobutanoate dehydrogenase subunit beta, partial [Dehalococcoidia bacterium]|nr:3-methyl-2-oxobutanoate dehydrogenase subunit beta [Dehalococcoidia bacterium]